jgi:hypothetical protein
LDTVPIAEIRAGEKVTFVVAPGAHIVAAAPTGVCGGGVVEVQTLTVPDATMTFRVGYGSNGDMGIYPTAF